MNFQENDINKNGENNSSNSLPNPFPNPLNNKLSSDPGSFKSSPYDGELPPAIPNISKSTSSKPLSAPIPRFNNQEIIAPSKIMPKNNLVSKNQLNENLKEKEMVSSSVTGYIVTIFILSLLLVASLAFIFYDKFYLNSDDFSDDVNVVTDQNQDMFGVNENNNLGNSSSTNNIDITNENNINIPISVGNSENPIENTAWVWLYTERSESEKINAPEGERFVLYFDRYDRRVFSYTDCNQISGNYILNQSIIGFGEFVSTKMFCQGSLESVYSNDLLLAGSYSIIGNELILNLSQNAGNMYFRAYDPSFSFSMEQSTTTATTTFMTSSSTDIVSDN